MILGKTIATSASVLVPVQSGANDVLGSPAMEFTLELDMIKVLATRPDQATQAPLLEDTETTHPRDLAPPEIGDFIVAPDSPSEAHQFAPVRMISLPFEVMTPASHPPTVEPNPSAMPDHQAVPVGQASVAAQPVLPAIVVKSKVPESAQPATSVAVVVHRAEPLPASVDMATAEVIDKGVGKAPLPSRPADASNNVPNVAGAVPNLDEPAETRVRHSELPESRSSKAHLEISATEKPMAMSGKLVPEAELLTNARPAKLVVKAETLGQSLREASPLKQDQPPELPQVPAGQIPWEQRKAIAATAQTRVPPITQAVVSELRQHTAMPDRTATPDPAPRPAPAQPDTTTHIVPTAQDFRPRQPVVISVPPTAHVVDTIREGSPSTIETPSEGGQEVVTATVPDQARDIKPKNAPTPASQLITEPAQEASVAHATSPDRAFENEAGREPMGELGLAETGATQQAITTTGRVPPAAIDHAPRVIHAIAQVAGSLQDRPVEIALNPEELGRVRLTLHVVDGAMAVAVAVERPETLELLRRNISLLEEQLREAGYQTLSFDLATEGQNHSDSEGRGFEDARRPNSAGPRALDDTVPDPIRLDLSHTAGLDIRY